MSKPIEFITKAFVYVAKNWLPKVILQFFFVGLCWYIEKKSTNRKLRLNYKKIIGFSQNMVGYEDTFFGAMSKSEAAYRSLALETVVDFNGWSQLFLATNKQFYKHTDEQFITNILQLYIKRIGNTSFSIFDKIETYPSNAMIIHEVLLSNDRRILFGERMGYDSGIYSSFLANFDPQEITKELVESFGKRVFISLSEEKTRENCSSEHKIIFEQLNHEYYNDSFWLENHQYDELVQDVKLFKDKNEQRTYMLLGPPGTGKTANVLKIIQNEFDSVIKIDGEVLEKSFSTIEQIFTSVNTRAILVDDADRVFASVSRLEKMLYVLESLKTTASKPFVFFTANNIMKVDEAVLRPGRIDKILFIECPNAEQRELFVRKYFKSINQPITEENIAKVVEATTDWSESYIKESCKQLAVGISIDVVIKELNTRNKIRNKKE